MTLLSTLKNKKILVLGLGEEGIDNLLFIKKIIPYKSLGVADVLAYENIDPKVKKHLTSDIKRYFGKNYLSSLNEYDVIVKSPGIPLHTIKYNKNQIVTSQSDIFLSNCKSKIIGITGTKGKSTTCTLLNNTLNNAGITSKLVGNIGKPALSYLLEEKKIDYFVYELSSFQLQTITKSPSIAVFLNIFKDHLDKHKNFKEYVSAKGKITLFQKKEDVFIYNEKDDLLKKLAKKTVAKKIPFSYNKLEDPVIKILEVLEVKIKFFEKTIKEFKGLPHRKEYIGKHRSIHFYNDSAATIPEATIKAIQEIENVQTVIIGGVDKGANFLTLIEVIRKSAIQNIIIFKGSNRKLEEMIKKTKKKVFFASNMEEAVDYCFKNTDQEKTCLLSPGFASFNMFKNYKERGELFRSFVVSKK